MDVGDYEFLEDVMEKQFKMIMACDSTGYLKGDVIGRYNTKAGAMAAARRRGIAGRVKIIDCGVC